MPCLLNGHSVLFVKTHAMVLQVKHLGTLFFKVKQIWTHYFQILAYTNIYTAERIRTFNKYFIIILAGLIVTGWRFWSGHKNRERGKDGIAS